MADFKDILSDEEKQRIIDSLNRNKPGIQVPPMETPKDPEQMLENIGVSGALPSSFPQLSGMFSPKDATYQGEGFSGRQMGIQSPTTGQPLLNREGGPLDISAAKAGSQLLKPQNYLGFAGKSSLGGINVLNKGSGFVPRTMTALEQRAALKDAGYPEQLPEELTGQPMYGPLPSNSDAALANLAKKYEEELMKKRMTLSAPSEIELARSSGEKTEPKYELINNLLRKK